MDTKLSHLFSDFFESEKTGGLILIVCTVISIVIANSPSGGHYLNFWQRYLDLSFMGIDLKYSAEHWINDGLMVIFFCSSDLRLKENFTTGSSRTLRMRCCR